MNKFLLILFIFFSVSCQASTVPTASIVPTEILLSATPSPQKRIMSEATSVRELKHPHEPSFTPPPTFTLEPTPIPELKGTFSLVFAKDPIPETAYFDLDNGSFNPILQENDLVAGLAIGTNIFLVVHPFGDSMIHAAWKKGDLEFDYRACKGSYGKGGDPINPDLYYCLHTNKGHMEQMMVVGIEDGNLTYGWQVDFKYVLWKQ